MDKVAKFITTDDLAWVSNRLMYEYNYANTKSPEEKNTEISILVSRALRFGLEELVFRFGYIIIDIPLANKRSARLVIPRDITERDVEIISHRMEMMIEEKAPEHTNETGIKNV